METSEEQNKQEQWTIVESKWVGPDREIPYYNFYLNGKFAFATTENKDLLLSKLIVPDQTERVKELEDVLNEIIASMGKSQTHVLFAAIRKAQTILNKKS